MKRKLKNLFCFAIALIVMTSFNLATFAADRAENAISNTTEHVTSENGGNFGVNLKIDENTVTPFSTWEGSAGVSRLDYMESSRYFTWSIDVTRTSTLPLVFTGQVDIYTLSGTFKGTVYLSGAGPGIASGTEPCISLTKGNTYTAKFSGSAVNSAKQVFTVVPDASINFYYR